MRNLKRALSLTLASVMLLGMMVVGAGAASYKDVSDDHNVEAIEVLQAVGAMIGDEAGNFDPDANVNRAQIATIMSRLLDLKVEDFNAADIPFTDVPEWAVPFVAACYADGITRGISDVLYGSNNDVTAVQAALMMMKALGYFQYQEDFDQDWQLATIKQASEIGLFDGVTVDRTSPLTRNDVAQMGLNALKARMVSFTGDVGSVYEVNGQTIRVGYKPEYTFKTSADPIYNRIDTLATTIDKPTGQYEMQLGEYLYGGDLRLEFGIDQFGRPARHWEFDGDDIGTYVREELLRGEYTSSVKGGTVFDLLSRSIIQDSELFVYVDGVECGKGIDGNTAHVVKDNLVRNYGTLTHTGRGVLTQVFYDNIEREITISMINTYLAQATTDFNEKAGNVSMVVYDGVRKTEHSEAVDVDEVPEIEGLAAEDWFLVHMSGMDSTDLAVVDVFDVTIMSDVEATRFETGKEDEDGNYKGNEEEDKIKAVTVDGTKYSTAKTQWFNEDVLDIYNDNRLVDKTYDLYLDQYGYAIGVDLHSGEAQYVFIAAYDMNGSNKGDRTASALAIFPDGTMDDIDVNVKATNKNIENDSTYAAEPITGEKVAKDVYHIWQDKQYTHTYGMIFNNVDPNANGNVENLWYSYSVNSSGVYTLAPAKDFTIEFNQTADEDFIQTDRVSLQKRPYGTVRSYGNDDSVYLTVDTDETNTFRNPVIDEVNGRYTGVQDVKLVYQPTDWVNAVVNSKGYVVAAVVLGEAEGVVDNYAYIKSGAYAEEKVGSDHFWDVDVIRNGVIETMRIKNNYEDTVQNLKVNTVQELVLDPDGYIVKVRDVANANNDVDADKYYDWFQYNKGNEEIDGYDVYYIDTGLINRAYAPNDISDISLVGRTLYFEEGNDFTGLAIAAGAKAVLYQVVNGDDTWTEYADVASAYRNVADAKDDASGKQFKGHVAAVLNSAGAAEWVVFYDETPVGGIGDGYGPNDPQGPVVFVKTWSTINSTRDLEILKGYTRANKYGVGHVYFELDAHPTTNNIDHNSDTISFIYNVYVGGMQAGDRVLHNKQGNLTRMGDGSGNFKFDEDLGNFFNEEDKIFVEIVSVTITPNPVDVTVDMDDSITGIEAAFTDEDGNPVNPGELINDAYAGMPVGVGLKNEVVRGRAASVSSIEPNTKYWVEFNGGSVVSGTSNAAGVLAVTVEINETMLKERVVKVVGIYDQDPNAGTPDPTKPVSSVTVSGLPATITEGDTVTLSTSTDTVTIKSGSTVDTSKAGTVTHELVLGTTNEKGFDAAVAITGWTLKEVSADGKTATFTKELTVAEKQGPKSDFDMKITKDAAPYDVELIYTGERPSDADIVKMFNEKLKELGKTEKGESIYPVGGNDIYAADGATVVGTITKKTTTYYILLNGKNVIDKATGENAVFDPTKSNDVTIVYTGTAKFVVDEDNWQNGYAVNGMNRPTVTVLGSKLNGANGNVKLVDAYQLTSLGSGIASIGYKNAGEDNTVTSVSSNLYVPTNGSTVVTGKVSTGGTHVQLTVGGKGYGDPVALETADHKYTLSMTDLTTEMVADGVVKAIDEEATNSYTVYFGDVKVETAEDVTAGAGWTLTDNKANSSILEGNYLLADDIKNGKYVAKDSQTPITVKRNAGNIEIDGITGAKSEVRLVPVTLVTFTEKAATGADAYCYIGGDEIKIVKNEKFWVKVGETMTFEGVTGETFQAMADVASSGKPTDWWTKGEKIPEVKDATKGVEIEVNQAVKKVEVETKTVAKDAALELQKTGTNDTIGDPTVAGTEPKVPNDGVADPAKIVVTVAPAAGYYFASALTPVFKDKLTHAGITVVLDTKTPVTIDKTTGALTFTVIATNTNT